MRSLACSLLLFTGGMDASTVEIARREKTGLILLCDKLTTFILVGSVDILKLQGGNSRRPEAIEVEGEGKQKGLAGLSGDGSAGSTAGEFTFDGGKDAFD